MIEAASFIILGILCGCYDEIYLSLFPRTPAKRKVSRNA